MFADDQGHVGQVTRRVGAEMGMACPIRGANLTMMPIGGRASHSTNIKGLLQ
jgi:hypothetical protein